ncbi:hypothetical protein C2E23DRAFT_312878 [Lenzites betulinus]|nr:hypothetical protein C2E23DRAFT_312878 [Lenzites betulinus]
MADGLPQTPQLSPGAIKLDDTLGAAFIGHFVTTLLYGITTLQAFMYYKRNGKDSSILKLAVLVIWIVDSLHAGLITGAIYWYCITNFTNLLAVQKPIWPIPTMIIVSNISNSIVRGIFGYRLWKLSNHNWVMPAIIAFFSVFIVVDATYFSVKLYSIPLYSDISAFSWSLYLGLSVEATVDLIVAITQCLLLKGFETGIRRTDMVIRVLITYTINTGILTSLCAFGALVAYAADPTKFIYFAFYFALSKLYVNSLLATLNARGSLLGGRRSRPRPALSKISFRAPIVSTDPSSSYDPESGVARDNIEFTTVISGDTPSGLNDDIVESIKDKRNESFP